MSLMLRSRRAPVALIAMCVAAVAVGLAAIAANTAGAQDSDLVYRVVAPATASEGDTGIESAGSYYNIIGNSFGGGAGRRFGGTGGLYQ